MDISSEYQYALLTIYLFMDETNKTAHVSRMSLMNTLDVIANCIDKQYKLYIQNEADDMGVLGLKLSKDTIIYTYGESLKCIVKSLCKMDRNEKDMDIWAATSHISASYHIDLPIRGNQLAIAATTPQHAHPQRVAELKLVDPDPALIEFLNDMSTDPGTAGMYFATAEFTDEEVAEMGMSRRGLAAAMGV